MTSKKEYNWKHLYTKKELKEIENYNKYVNLIVGRITGVKQVPLKSAYDTLLKIPWDKTGFRVKKENDK